MERGIAHRSGELFSLDHHVLEIPARRRLHSTLDAQDGLGSNDVRTIVGGRDRTLWIGTGLGVARYDNGRFESYGPAQGIPSGEVRALYVDGDGALWIGTYGGGLARWKDGRATRFGTYDGLLDAGVHRIIEDPRGDFWLTGDRGIRRVSRRELAAIADGARAVPASRSSIRRMA